MVLGDKTSLGKVTKLYNNFIYFFCNFSVIYFNANSCKDCFSCFILALTQENLATGILRSSHLCFSYGTLLMWFLEGFVSEISSMCPSASWLLKLNFIIVLKISVKTLMLFFFYLVLSSLQLNSFLLNSYCCLNTHTQNSFSQ